MLKKEVFIENDYNGNVLIDGTQPADNSIKNVAVIPLEAKNGEVIGVVVCKNKQDGFSREDVKKFDLGEGEIGSAFRMGLENKALKAESITDKLTLLPNRKGAADYLKSEVLPSLKNNQEVSVVMCDIDHFKHVNDTFGHDAGDKVLQHVSKIISENTRDSDSVFRWGGEEMVIIMNGADTETAYSRADQIREKIQNSPCDIGDGKTISVTMSMGVQQLNLSEMPNLNESNIFSQFENTALKAADEKLYVAKESGRNKVVADKEISQRLGSPEPPKTEKTNRTQSESHTAQKINSDLIAAARNADLANYFMTHGFEYKEEKRNEVHILNYGGLRINTEKNAWYQFSESRGNSNPIDCLTTVLGMDFKTAVRELTGKDFLESKKAPAVDKKSAALPSPSTENIKLPERDTNVKKLYAYFLSARHIDKSVVAELLNGGNLYQDKRGNAVFVRRDENGNAVGAEIHGTNTYKRYKGVVGEGNHA